MGFSPENITIYAQQLDQFVDEIRAAKSKIKKNIKKNTLQIAKNQPEQADDPRCLYPDYNHHDLCPDAQDVFWLIQSLKHDGFMLVFNCINSIRYRL